LIETDAKIARGAAALYLASIATLVLNTLFLVLLTNYFGGDQTKVGLVSFLNVVLVSATTVSVLALPIGGLGVVATPPAVTRFFSLYRGMGQNSGRGVYFLSLLITGVISLGIVALSAYSPVANLVGGPLQASAVFFACIDALVYSFGQLGAYSMLGREKTTTAGKLIILSSFLRYTFASLLLIQGWGPSGVFIGFAFGDSVLAVSSNAGAVRDMSRQVAVKAPMKPVVKYMLSVFLAALMGLAVSQSDKLLAFLQLGLPPLAIYNIATVGAAVASFVTSAATNVLVPALGSYFGKEEEKRRMLKAYTRHICLTAMPLGFVLAAISPFLLRLFGDAYATGAPVLAVIAISISLTSVAAVYSSDLLIDDKAHHFTISNLVGLVGLLVVSYLTVPYYGFFGIALGRSVMLFITLGLTAYFVWRPGRLVLDEGAYVKSLGAAVVMALFVYTLLRVAGTAGVGRLGEVGASLIMIPVGLMSYLLIMKALKAFNEDDIAFLELLLPGWLGGLSKLARKLL
jgi:O-antigen/teichoic acid export membrane protein